MWKAKSTNNSVLLPAWEGKDFPKLKKLLESDSLDMVILKWFELPTSIISGGWYIPLSTEEDIKKEKVFAQK